MIDLIQQGLARIESEQQVKILYACESGSRAWGFASQDSDYDVRFIYCHPRSWYLSIFEQRDVIECPIVGDLDINGWDLRKALQLASKSNPALLEWMRSPIVYRQDAEFVDRFRPLMDECYSAAAMFHHYLHMAQRNFKEHLRGDTVRAKKYFYVLRPILACRWIIADYGVPPMEFAKLVDMTCLPIFGPIKT